jgi:hypothetical protein
MVGVTMMVRGTSLLPSPRLRTLKKEDSVSDNDELQSLNNANCEINNNRVVSEQRCGIDNATMIDNAVAMDNFEVTKGKCEKAFAESASTQGTVGSTGKTGALGQSLHSEANVVDRTSDLHHIARLLGN